MLKLSTLPRPSLGLAIRAWRPNGGTVIPKGKKKRKPPAPPIFAVGAEYGAEYGHPAPVKVIGLGDPDDEPMIDEMYGILCEVRLEGKIVTVPLGEIEDAKGKPNRQLVADYSYWFWNWR